MRAALVLAFAMLMAGCASAPPGTAPAATRPETTGTSDAQAPDVSPVTGTASFEAIGLCTREGERVSCKGASGDEDAELAVGRNGTLSVRFEWTAETPQTEELSAFIRRGDEGVGARGRSPLVVEWAVTPGTYGVGVWPGGDASAGYVRQTAAWTATLTR